MSGAFGVRSKRFQEAFPESVKGRNPLMSGAFGVRANTANKRTSDREIRYDKHPPVTSIPEIIQFQRDLTYFLV